MNKRKVVSWISGASILFLAATSAPAFAHGVGGHGHGHGDGNLGMLAIAAGVSHEQIHSAFKNDAALKTDFQNLKTAREAMNTCIVAGTCTTEISNFAAAQQALTQEKMTVWQGIFKNAPNKAQAVSVKTQLDALKTQHQQIMQQVFSVAKGGTPGATGTQTQTQQ